ncbi:uncharacterized protein LOC134821764 isoform X2 [Bolinopsis microptera]|uniref:uncharacterized protein LOC134821764 isoform X2 n=1 Tax=Bolinopsis microptera TaxID=2820187 RepID=UPI00307A18BF
MTPPAKKGRYNLMKLENLAPRLAAEQLSNGTAARFLSKYNEVVGIQEQVTEKKIRNIRAKSRGALLDNLKGTAVEALYFDGRKDRGTLLKDSDEVLRRQEEEHITLVEQPSGRYLGFATPDSGSGVDTVRAIGEHCKELGIDISGLKCCGCDGTSTNTGRHSGVVVLLEKKLGRELQRSVCSLHRIELPFRHFFTSLDGVTTGPNSFSGPIGKLAAGPVHQMASRKFVPLRAHTFSPLPDGVVKKLSWDQKVLYRHVLAVQTGALPPKLAGTEIGPLCHARWITFQSRILRLFMSGGVPGNVMGKLRKLAEYVVNIYFPMHMFIKYYDSIVYGSVNLFQEISFIKKVIKSKSERDFILNGVQVNSYFAHPHNILIAMLGDKNYVLRKKAVDLILDLRGVDEVCTELNYYLPRLNFDAEVYSDLCKMSKVNDRWVYLSFKGDFVYVTEPPLTKGLDVLSFLSSPFKSDLPCHTQSVERLVKVTTDASKRVCGRVNQSAEGMLVIAGRGEKSVK